MYGRQNDQLRPAVQPSVAAEPFNHPAGTPIYLFNTMDRSPALHPQLFNISSQYLLHPLGVQPNIFYTSHVRPPQFNAAFSGSMTADNIQSLQRYPAPSSEPVVKRKTNPLPIINPLSGLEIRLRPPIVSSKSRNGYKNGPSLLTNNTVGQPTKESSTTASPTNDKDVIDKEASGTRTPSPDTTKPCVHKIFTRNSAIVNEIRLDKSQSSIHTFTSYEKPEKSVQDDDSSDMLKCLIRKLRNSGNVPSDTKEPDVHVNKEILEQKDVSKIETDNTASLFDDDLPPEIRDLINPEMKITNVFDRKDPVQEEPQEWLPSEMQMSDDDDKIDEYLADIEVHPGNLQSTEIEPSKMEAEKKIDNEEDAEADPVLSKQLSRSFIISCYANPATRQKPENMTNSSVVLSKPLDNLLDVLKKSMHVAEQQYGMMPMRGLFSRSEMGRGSMNKYGAPVEVHLHHAQQPYIVKSTKELNDIEMMTRQFRSLMNKVTDGNMSRIVQKMLELDLNRDELYIPILEVIFDKAIQEPNFCHIYAEICNVLCKNLRINKVDENGDTVKYRFKTFLIIKVQKAFENRVTDNADYIEKEKELQVTTSEVTKKRLKDELDEIIRNLKRKYMGNMKLIGQLFCLNVLSRVIVVKCIQRLFEKDEGEWQYESLCKLLIVIGSLIDSETPKFMDDIFAKMKKLLPNISDNRIKFMFLNLFDTRANKWQTKKPKESTAQLDKPNHSNTYSSRVSGYSNQSRHQYVGSSSSANKLQGYETSQHQLNFDSLDSFDRSASRNRRQYNPSINRSSDKYKLSDTSLRKTSVPKNVVENVPKNVVAPSTNKHPNCLEKLKELINTKPPMKPDDQEAQMKLLLTDIPDAKRFWKESIHNFYTSSLDYEENCLQFGCMVFWVIRNKDLSEQAFIDSTNEIVWKSKHIWKLDIPKLFSNMGALFSNVFNPKNSCVGILPEILKPIALTEDAIVFIAHMLEIACKTYSNETVKKQLEFHRLDFHKYCQQEKLQQILSMKALDKILPGEMYRKDLYNYLATNLSLKNKSNNEIISEIKAKFNSKELLAPKIMQAVISAMLYSSVEIGENKPKCNSKLIDERVNVLLWFVKDEEYEMEAIKTICEFVAAAENPYGLLQELLTVFCCNNLISEKTFDSWRQIIDKSDASNSNMAPIALSARKFFTWFDHNKPSDEAGQSGDDD